MGVRDCLLQKIRPDFNLLEWLSMLSDYNKKLEAVDQLPPAALCDLRIHLPDNLVNHLLNRLIKIKMAVLDPQCTLHDVVACVDETMAQAYQAIRSSGLPIARQMEEVYKISYENQILRDNIDIEDAVTRLLCEMEPHRIDHIVNNGTIRTVPLPNATAVTHALILKRRLTCTMLRYLLR